MRLCPTGPKMATRGVSDLERAVATSVAKRHGHNNRTCMGIFLFLQLRCFDGSFGRLDFTVMIIILETFVGTGYVVDVRQNCVILARHPVD